MERKIGIEVRNLQNMIMRRMDSIASESTGANISAQNVFILSHLYENQGKDIFQKDLERAMAVSRSTCSKVVSLMEEKGLIRREGVKDARFNKIVITEKGTSTIAMVREKVDENETLLKEGLSEEDMRNFYRIIDTMEENIKKG